MSQPRHHSALESVANVAVGFGINYTTNMIFFPMFGWHISTTQNLTLGVIYTGISLVRSYFLRRYFNRWTRKLMQK